jgi:hypothetical protein
MFWEYLLLFGSFYIGVIMVIKCWKKRHNGFAVFLIIFGFVIILTTGLFYYLFAIMVPLHTFLFTIIFYLLWLGFGLLKEKYWKKKPEKGMSINQLIN